MLRRVNAALFEAPPGALIRVVVEAQGNNGVNDARFEYGGQILPRETILGLPGCSFTVADFSERLEAVVVFDPGARDRRATTCSRSRTASRTTFRNRRGTRSRRHSFPSPLIRTGRSQRAVQGSGAPISGQTGGQKESPETGSRETQASEEEARKKKPAKKKPVKKKARTYRKRAK